MAKQLKLNSISGKWGGRRSGSGRKRIKSPGVAHRRRETLNNRTPVHVNIKYRKTIRNKETLKILKRAILNARKKGLKILHYSLQSNHLHLILEAGDTQKLSLCMRSLTVTLARGLNSGKIQLQRYHLHVLRSLKETKNAIRYVLFNQQKHSGSQLVRMDGYCSLSIMPEIRKITQKAGFTLVFGKAVGIMTDSAASFLGQQGMRQLII